MNRIRLLPEQVANQIAAGEVIERPASVVKELVENALDAQSARLTVEIQAGGRGLIRVTDDGLGMSRDDALLCLERHATSKIRRAEDLHVVRTMGFRGEALPSIASVSRMTLTTREREGDAAATQVIIHGGKLLEVKAAGSPPGTCIEVRQLFFNLPARRKFLRSEETEYAHIHHYLTLAALAYPEVAFTFLKEARTVWQLPAVAIASKPGGRLAALRERFRALLGSADGLLPVECSAALAPATESEAEEAPEQPTSLVLWGLLGQPGVSRATREDQHLFVNRRPVENRGLNYALMEGYHTALMKGRYPVCCLFLEIDPAEVDVNIHPAKREVKFRNERAVRRFVTQAIRQSLLKFHQVETPPAPAPPPASSGTQSPPVGGPGLSSPVEVPAPQPPPGKADLPESAPPPPIREFPQFPALTGTPLQAGPRATGATPPVKPLYPVPSPPSPPPAASPTLNSQLSTLNSSAPTPLLQVPLRLLGVIGRLYVVLESDRGLVLMDQHAAHERVLFEQMLSRLEHGQTPAQRLLLPETVELSVRDAHFLRELLPVLNRLGVNLSEFGERTFLLDALPPFVTVAQPKQFVLGLLDGLKAAGQEVNAMRLGEDLVAKTVCRHAVKARDPLTGPELEKLIEDLRYCAMPYTCPHGRPTLIEMSFRELEKKFGRQV
jgi:DNA mismatch repair protein MutL